MKKILFATEFSDHAPEVFRYALEIAHFFNARLIVMHALNQPEVRSVPEAEILEMADGVTTQLMEFVEANTPEEFKAVKINYVAQTGLAADAILEVADDEKADIIVIGKTGKTNIFDQIFGSTTLDVLHKAACPVFVIPANCQFDGIDNLVFLTNFEFADLAAIQYLKKWRKVFGASLHCFHGTDELEKYNLARQKRKTLKKLFKGNKLVFFKVKLGDLKEELHNFAQSKQADVVAMVLPKRNLLARLKEQKSLKGIALKASTPLLVLKENYGL